MNKKMKRTFFFIILYLILTTFIIAQEQNKRQVRNYYIDKKDITNTVNFALVKWNYSSVTTPNNRKEIIYGMEIELYKTGNNNPVEKIILKNGTVGGNLIYFEEAISTSKTNSLQKFVAHYGESLSDEEPAVFVIWIFEADNIGPNTEVITLIIDK